MTTERLPFPIRSDLLGDTSERCPGCGRYQRSEFPPIRLASKKPKNGNRQSDCGNTEKGCGLAEEFKHTQRIPEMTATEPLAQYQALADQATSGPWSFLPLVNGMPARTVKARPGFGTPTVASVQAEPDGAFITASRSLGPAMAAALQEILSLNEPICTSFTEVDPVEAFAKGYSRALQDIHYLVFDHLEG